MNVERESKVTFYLTYEQLLQREDNQYELVINIHPKQPVKDLRVHVREKSFVLLLRDVVNRTILGEHQRISTIEICHRTPNTIW